MPTGNLRESTLRTYFCPQMGLTHDPAPTRTKKETSPDISLTKTVTSSKIFPFYMMQLYIHNIWGVLRTQASFWGGEKKCRYQFNTRKSPSHVLFHVALDTDVKGKNLLWTRINQSKHYIIFYIIRVFVVVMKILIIFSKEDSVKPLSIYPLSCSLKWVEIREKVWYHYC